MALADYPCTVCNTCEELAMPVFGFADDSCPPEQRESEINKLYVTIEDTANPGTPLGGPVDWTLAADWATAIDNAVADKVRELTVIGDLPEPEQETRIVSNRRRIMAKKIFTVNATIDDTSDANYDALRGLECNIIVRFWYGDIGGKLYGGQNGIRATVTRANAPKDRGENTYDRFELSFLWESFCHPERIDNPIA